MFHEVTTLMGIQMRTHQKNNGGMNCPVINYLSKIEPHKTKNMSDKNTSPVLGLDSRPKAGHPSKLTFCHF